MTLLDTARRGCSRPARSTTACTRTTCGASSRTGYTMIGSDGLPNDPLPHPRLWGAFPRVLGHYSRDVGLFPLEEAVHKMTGLTASRFGLEGRGCVRRGHHADLVLFNPGHGGRPRDLRKAGSGVGGYTRRCGSTARCRTGTARPTGSARGGWLPRSGICALCSMRTAERAAAGFYRRSRSFS